MKNLSNLRPAPGSNRPKKRVGRGPGSGLGKTAGRGHGGQKSRKGGGIAPGFEGGQTPLYRRIPKRGFTNPFQKTYNIVNLAALNKFAEGTVVSPEVLKEAGLLHNSKNPIKILGKGSLEKKLTVKAQKFSGSAKAAVEKAGGVAEEIK
ncbi:MAG: 50S ribosomal protein L15 [Bdellovibrionota bacterium]